MAPGIFSRESAAFLIVRSAAATTSPSCTTSAKYASAGGLGAFVIEKISPCSISYARRSGSASSRKASSDAGFLSSTTSALTLEPRLERGPNFWRQLSRFVLVIIEVHDHRTHVGRTLAACVDDLL